MWLLHTRERTLQYFDKPPPRYAVLSHVWQKDEQSFQDIQLCQPASFKIEAACTHACSDGYQWLWIDTCCIDKTNSAELSEAINSMFRWYANATVCYVYMSDVSPLVDPSARNSSFRTSTWFTRGWTLQELVAPKNVVFFSGDWQLLGNKAFLAKLLEQITGIDIEVLTHRVSLASISVAKRMSWASSRQTTRVEDAAYCLMGIFDINMPTIYGEGTRAFRRLQEEIMKSSSDHTLFTWGRLFPLHSFSPFLGPSSLMSEILPPSEPLTLGSPAIVPAENSVPGGSSSSLLATCARSFAMEHLHTSIIESMRYDEFTAALEGFNAPRVDDNSSRSGPETHPVPEFTITSHGIRAHLPLVHLPLSCMQPDDAATDAPQYYVAVLACRMPHLPSRLVGLVLRRSRTSYLHQVGGTFRNGVFARCLSLDPTHHRFQVAADSGLLAPVHTSPAYQWADFYIEQQGHAIATLPLVAPSPPGPMPRSVFIPQWITAGLVASGFEPPTMPRADISKQTWQPISISHMVHHTYVLSHPPTQHDVHVHVGTCEADGLWLTVELVDLATGSSSFAEPLHSLSSDSPETGCPKAHISDWHSEVPGVASKRAALDDSGLQWDRYRTLVIADRAVHLRLAKQGGCRENKGELWMIGIEVTSATSERPPSPAFEMLPEIVSGLVGLPSLLAFPSLLPGDDGPEPEASVEVEHASDSDASPPTSHSYTSRRPSTSQHSSLYPTRLADKEAETEDEDEKVALESRWSSRLCESPGPIRLEKTFTGGTSMSAEEATAVVSEGTSERRWWRRSSRHTSINERATLTGDETVTVAMSDFASERRWPPLPSSQKRRMSTGDGPLFKNETLELQHTAMSFHVCYRRSRWTFLHRARWAAVFP